MSSNLMSLLWSVPSLIIAITGIVVALGRWSRHPTVSLVALIAFAFMLASVLGSTALQTYGRFLTSNGTSPSERLALMQLALPIIVLLGFFSNALLILAIFGWRTSPVAYPSDQ